MNKESENALQLLTGKTNLGDVLPEELQQLADAHPYFAAAQLLLAQKMKQTQSGNLPGQLQKTALFFPNEQWLSYLLSNTKEEAVPLVEIAGGKTATEFATEQTTATGIAVAQADTEQPGEIGYGSVRTDDFKQVSEHDLPDANIYQPAAERAENRTEETSIPATETEDANLITLPAEQIAEEVFATGNIADEPEEAPLDDEELQQQAEEFPLAPASQKILSLLSGQVKEFHKPVAEDTDLPVAAPEPFHTIDYFASQGIKLDPKREENTFDKKVHKFTDWLRQMKRINPQPADLGTETEEERFVASIADSSNHTKKVLTESMAEVLLKQGKRDKAIEIYQKLSLLNPDKSVYFAALIQNIK